MAISSAEVTLQGQTYNLTYNSDTQEWLPPKTDWTATDYFNAVDYNRIIGNLAYLSAMANELYETEIISLGQTKDYTSMIYAREINAIENALEKINLETVNLDIGDKSTFVPNGRTPPWTEFNRIENACLLLNKVMAVHKKSLSRLAFKLGKRGVKF